LLIFDLLKRILQQYFEIGIITAWVLIGLTTLYFADDLGLVRKPSSGQSCLANLKQLDGAKASWAPETGKTNLNATPTDSELFAMAAYIRTKPVCPGGGTYTIGSIGQQPQCSIPVHSIEAGDVYVRDELQNPVTGAMVRVVGASGYRTEAMTDTNGFATIDLWSRGASGVRISKAGYNSHLLSFTNRWPFRVVLRK